MRRKIGLILSILSLGIVANAAEVTTQAGGLAEAVADDITATSLTVEGEINAADIAFIAEKMTELTTLDLSGAKIVAYSGEPIIIGKKEYAENTLPAYSLMGTKISSIVLPSGLVEIGEASLSSTPLASITIPGTVTTIGQGAFSNCDELVLVELPASVTEVASHAFLDCDKLATVKCGAGITTISQSMFARCKSLSDVTLSDNVNVIDAKAFAGCSSLANVVFPAKLTKIGDEAFQQTGLVEANMSLCESLTEIGEWAFSRCASLQKVVLNNNVSSIGEGAFFDNAQLAEFNVPASCTSISDYMMKGDANVGAENLLHAGVAEIGNYSLMGMNNVSTFTLPASVMAIGNNAFEGWTALKELNVVEHTDVPQLGENVWQGVDQSLATLNVSNATMYDAFSAADQWSEFNIEIADLTGVLDEELFLGRVDAYFVGNNLVVKASSEIVDMHIYDSSGRQYLNIAPKINELTIDASAWDCNIYIAKIVLVSGETATMKIARR